MTGKKKLIEVALPLDEINVACKADKSRNVGTIRNIHKWFAPMPLPAWRALLFASLIDDPGDDEKRAYLLDVVKRLVEHGADAPDEDSLLEARRIIDLQFPDGLPTVMDPFCGGGSTLVEAQRLGLPTFGSDLNPVPVLITRTLTEMLPKFHGYSPLHPETPHQEEAGQARSRTSRRQTQLFEAATQFEGLEGLIGDVTYYAGVIRDQAWNKLKDLYPSPAGDTPIAWIWARTAPCPNPACGIESVLTTSWWLSKKQGALAWIEPSVSDGKVVLNLAQNQVVGSAPSPPKTARGAAFICLGCGGVIGEKHVREVAQRGDLGLKMLAIVVDGPEGRAWRVPTEIDELAASSARAGELASLSLGDPNQYTAPPRYGLMTIGDLSTARQLQTLSTFAECISDVTDSVIVDGGEPDYAAAIVTLLGLALGKLAQYLSSLTRIELPDKSFGAIHPAFARPDFPMTWDFAEIYAFGDSGPTWMQLVQTMSRAVVQAPRGSGVAVRADARTVKSLAPSLIATDPPYFDAIPYADLSDFFYVWHRAALKRTHPDLYQTLASPKSGELTAFPWHHGGTRELARNFFIEGFTETFGNLQSSMESTLPMIIVYASKEQKSGRGEETRWSSILTAMVSAGLEITGTWPIHGTGSTRMRSQGSSAVATYVAMVCRPRPATAGACSLADFNRSLRRELKSAVHDLQAAGILPVDLAQAAMGPGMQIYSRYREVVGQAGDRVPVEQALRLINAALGEVLDEQEGELDPDSRFAVTWWEKYGWDAAPFGEADQLARPQGLEVDGLIRAGVATYPKAGFVSLLGSEQLNRDWVPATDSRPTAWEAVHHLADRLIDGGGVTEAGRLMGQLGLLRDPAQALVYRLHAIAARKGRAKDQERYNALIGSWSDCLAVAATEKDGLF